MQLVDELDTVIEGELLDAQSGRLDLRSEFKCVATMAHAAPLADGWSILRV